MLAACPRIPRQSPPMRGYPAPLLVRARHTARRAFFRAYCVRRVPSLLRALGGSLLRALACSATACASRGVIAPVPHPCGALLRPRGGHAPPRGGAPMRGGRLGGVPSPPPLPRPLGFGSRSLPRFSPAYALAFSGFAAILCATRSAFHATRSAHKRGAGFCALKACCTLRAPWCVFDRLFIFRCLCSA